VAESLTEAVDRLLGPTRAAQDHGMRSSLVARLLFAMARWLRWKRRRRLMAMLIAVVARLEGGECFSVTARRILSQWYEVEIGSFSYGAVFQPGRFPGKTRVGRYCSIAPTARSVERNHPLDRVSTSSFFYDPHLGVVDRDLLPPYEPLVIGDDVWIGHNVVLLPGCRAVGSGSVVGACAAVVSDVPAYGVVGGVPAKQLRKRFTSDQESMLLRSQWWLLSPAALRTITEHFREPVVGPAVDAGVGMSAITTQPDRSAPRE
jgi:virginiamycin A acetyltransferase